MSIRTNPTQPIVGPKTYAETQQRPAFDWRAFLRNPPLRSSEEHDAAYMRANQWVTCACGNQCSIIPRHSEEDEHRHGYPIMEGAPVDKLLRDLGYNFACQIEGADWSEARKTLAAIEHRSAELIAELTQP
jgi:hypothetical protein